MPADLKIAYRSNKLAPRVKTLEAKMVEK